MTMFPTPARHNLRRYWAKRRCDLAKQRLELFAEALAEGASIPAAASWAGVQDGSQLLQKLKDQLGWQAQ